MNCQVGQNSIEWSKEMTMKLIEELKKRKSLWDVNSQEYKDKNRRKSDFQELAAIFSVSFPEMEKKVHSLKSRFHREYRRSRGKSSPYKSNWFGFQHLKFLRQVDKFKIIKVENENDQLRSRNVSSESSSIDVPSSTVPTSPNRTSAYIKKQLDIKDVFVESKDSFYSKITDQSYRLSRDEHTVFGEYITYELRKIDNPYVLAVTKHKIQECLYEAQMNLLSTECDLNTNEYLPTYFSKDEECPNTTPSA